MEIKETVKTKLVRAKDKSVAFVKKAWPYPAVVTASIVIMGIENRAYYAKGYSRGFFAGNQTGKKAVIEIINDLAKSVETK